MGYIFEELIRKFSEQANEEAGDHFTPREVIRLMVNLLFEPDADILTKKGIVRTMLDPACGTGGMLSVSDEYLEELNPDARLEMFGQDYNAESFAICCSDMMIKGQNPENIRFGDSFTDDGFPQERFDYMLANPPFGVEWKPEEEAIRKEAETQGFSGRFGAGLPRINDGAFLFLQHMISKMRPPEKGGSRIGIVFNGSPLFTGDAGSGESEIRRWIIENDWLDAIIALPDQLFYNTGIFTYIWIVTNRKVPKRRGKVQLINAVAFYQKMRKSLGQKRNELSDDHIAEITRIYGRFKHNETATVLIDGKQEEIVVSKVFDNDDFGFRKIRVERPLRLSFYAYGRFLLSKLPRQSTGPRYHFDDEVALEFYRLEKMSDGAIELKAGENGEVKGPTAVGTGKSQDEQIELSQLIDLINERFGTDFKPADQLFLDQVREEAVANEVLRQAAAANTIDNFKYVFAKALEDIFIDRMEQNESIFARFMNDQDFQHLVEKHLRRRVYDQIRGELEGQA